MKTKAAYSPLSVRFDLTIADEGLDFILAAANAFSESAYVVIDKRGRKLRLRLRPRRRPTKKNLETLAAAFEAELSRCQGAVHGS